MEMVQAIVPVFALLVMGNVLRRIGMPAAGFWEPANKLCFFVFVPALLFGMLARQRIEVDLLTPFALMLAGSFFLTGAATYVCARVVKLPEATLGVVMQGALQHNTFISLALSEQLYGSDGLILAAMASGVLVFTINVSIVPMLVMLDPRHKGQSKLWPILRSMSTNPLILSVSLGLAASLLLPGPIPVFQDIVDMLGEVTLPLVLLCVGAGLRLRGLPMSTGAIAISTFGKLLLFPMFMLLIPNDLGHMELMVLMLFAVVPTAPIASALAAQTGGDVPLMNAIITIQTALSFVTLPLTLALAAKHIAL